MILRMLMWRRRTDPKTAPHVLCERAQSTCTWRFHKSHFIRKFTKKMPRHKSHQLQLGGPILYYLKAITGDL